MDKLIEQATKIMLDDPLLNEVVLSNGKDSVRLVKGAPNITYWASWPCNTYQVPQY